LRINSVEHEAKYLFVKEIELPAQAIDSIGGQWIYNNIDMEF
jgi:hypothetical protein